MSHSVQHIILEGSKSAVIQGIPDFFHHIVVKIQVMKHAESHAKHFLCLEQVSDVGSRISPAGWALAVLLDWTHVLLKLLVKEIQLAKFCVYMSMSSISGWIYTVKEVDSYLHTL